jgi:hypothetical protein
MQRAKVTQEELKERENVFVALRVETPNANLLLLSQDEDQLGTLAVALPQSQKLIGPSLSSVLLGDKNVILARAMAERLAAKTGKIALTSVFIKTLTEREAGPILLKLFDKTIQPKQEEQKTE